jgi:hypothetical protein
MPLRCRMTAAYYLHALLQLEDEGMKLTGRCHVCMSDTSGHSHGLRVSASRRCTHWRRFDSGEGGCSPVAVAWPQVPS